MIQSIQWAKDSHGLFDYEMRQITKSNFVIRHPKVVLRDNTRIEFENHDVDIKALHGTTH